MNRKTPVKTTVRKPVPEVCIGTGKLRENPVRKTGN